MIKARNDRQAFSVVRGFSGATVLLTGATGERDQLNCYSSQIQALQIRQEPSVILLNQCCLQVMSASWFWSLSFVIVPKWRRWSQFQSRILLDELNYPRLLKLDDPLISFTARTCSMIESEHGLLYLQVYLVIRASVDRQGCLVSPESRLRAMLRGAEFAHLHKQTNSILARISVISADLTLPGLGLSEEEALQLKL